MTLCDKTVLVTGAAGFVGDDHGRKQCDEAESHVVTLETVDLRALGEGCFETVLEGVQVDVRAVRHDLDLGSDFSHGYGPVNPQSGHS